MNPATEPFTAFAVTKSPNGRWQVIALRITGTQVTDARVLTPVAGMDLPDAVDVMAPISGETYLLQANPFAPRE